MALSHFMRRRVTFAKHLEGSNSGLNPSRYLRLMLLAMFEMFASAAAVSATLAFSVVWDMRPWTNWADVHWDFSRIDTYPTPFLPPFIYRFYYACWWIAPVSAYVFCAFFAFGQEAMNEYKAWGRWVWRVVLRQKPLEQKQKGFKPINLSSAGFVAMPSPPPRYVLSSRKTLLYLMSLSRRSTFGLPQHLSLASLPTIDISSSGEMTPTTAGSIMTPISDLPKKQPFVDTKEDTLLTGAPIMIYGIDDDLPSYYASSPPNSRPHSSVPSVQVVPTDVDLTDEAHAYERMDDEPHAL